MPNDLIKIDTWKEKEIVLYNNDRSTWKYRDMNNNVLDNYYVHGIDYLHIVNSVLVSYSILRNTCSEFLKFKSCLNDSVNNLFVIDDVMIVTTKGSYLEEKNRKINEEYKDSRGVSHFRRVKNKYAGKYTPMRMKIIIPVIKVREQIISYIMRQDDLYKIFRYVLYYNDKALSEIKRCLIKELVEVFSNIGSDGLTFNQYIDSWCKRLLKETEMIK